MTSLVYWSTQLHMDGLIHEGHLVLAKCKLRTKDTVYWPGLNEDLEKLILNCELYLKYFHSKCKQKPIFIFRSENSSASLDQACTGTFHFEGSSYLLLVDYRSRFPVVSQLFSMTGENVANQCKLIFSEYGWSKTLISDNGPCFTSQGFTCVMQSHNVNHIKSSPHYPQSNGLAEKYVQIVKGLFYKAKEEGKDFYKCLMIYHNTLLTVIMKSPMQILQGRNARSDFPMSNAARKQLGIWHGVVRNNDKHAVLLMHDPHVG